MSLQDRITQFRNMVEADPENELGHFSLGKAYLEAEQYADAIPSFRRVTEINPSFSRAYQHLAEAQLKTDDRSTAIATLTKGYAVARKNGDVMPRDAMGDMLKTLGHEPPALETEAQSRAAETDVAGPTGFRCCRCGSGGSALPERPFKGRLGEQVLAEICQPCWREWIGVGTKVINEFRLDLSDPKAQELYDEQMKEFLNLR